eukprot:CCRYP_003584-RE/>CCRYP_003584-RE protein AED:0.50 eAED:1.00 QI:0/-1/0/1/-1/0/1/0/7
MEKSPLT